MKRNLIFIISFCLLFFNQSLKSQTLYEYFGDVVNLSNSNNRNINHPDGSHTQNLKRSTGIILKTEGNITYSCSCTLINDVKQSKTPFILTAEHCLPDGLAEGAEYDVLLSFDYEMSDALERGNDPITSIAKLYRVKAKVSLRDVTEDNALLSITPLNGGENDFIKLLKNVYASGWNNSLENNDGHLNVSHPKRDHKKIFINPALSGIYRNRFDDKPQGYIYKVDAPWNGNTDIGARPQGGSSGSGLFNDSLQLNGVSSRGSSESSWNLWKYNLYSHLSNSWYGPDDRVTLQDLLDDGETWLTEVPGGYYNDLVALDDLDFSIEIQPGVVLQTPGVNPNDPTKLLDEVLAISASNFYERSFLEKLISSSNKIEYWEKILGLKLNTSNNSKVFLTVYYPDKGPGGLYTLRLLYGGFANSSTTIDEYGFQIEGWDCNSPPAGYPPCNRSDQPYCNVCTDTEEDVSTNVKKSLTNAASDWSIDLNRIILFTDLKIPVIVQLHNLGAEAVKVQALSYPAEPPKNALQLFSAQEVENRYKSYKYPTSRGEESMGLFIDEITIKEYDPDLPDIVSFEKTIKTNNNGGYLNLVNLNYKIGALDATGGADLTELSFEIKLKENHNKTYSYHVWIDYFNIDELNGKNNNSFSYNFVADPVPHDIEEVAFGTGVTGDVVSFRYQMPHFSQIRMKPGEERTTRMRIAIKEGNQLPEQDKTFLVGEVEDYLIEIQAPDCDELRPDDYAEYAEEELPYCGQGGYREAKEPLADVYEESVLGSLIFDIQNVNSIQFAKTKVPQTYEIASRYFIDNKDESVNGTLEEQSLLMDVYYPIRSENAGTYKSQLIIYVFGGGFIGGERNNRLAKETCKWLAKRGYVVAAIDYRLGMDAEDKDLAKRAVLRAWQDSRAAVQYWRGMPEHISGNETLWSIDSDKVYVLGHSAGGITSQHNVYLSYSKFEQERVLGNFLASANLDYDITYIQDVGPNIVAKAYDLTDPAKTTTVCLDLNCSTPLSTGVDGQANKAVSFAGAIGKKEWATANIRAMDIHHFEDGTVDYQSATPFGWIANLANWTGVLDLPSLDGGFAIGQYMDSGFAPATQAGGDSHQFNGNYVLQSLSQDNQAGMGNSLIVPYHYPQLAFGNDIDEVGENTTGTKVEPKVMYLVDAFFTKESNGATLARIATPVRQEEPQEQIQQEQPIFKVFPNPASTLVNIVIDIPQDGPLSIELIDLQGTVVYEREMNTISEGTQWIRLSNLGVPAGVYVLKLMTTGLKSSEQLVVKD